jgi:hypothetical protein
MLVDYRNMQGLPLGLRNNNPGNIRPLSKQKYIGQVGTNGGFIVFDSLQHGIRAMLVDINNKRKRGLDTIEKIISVWAPPQDNNDTRSYINTVSKLSGIPSSEIISTPGELGSIVLAMIYVENGNIAAKYVTPEHIREAASMVNIKSVAKVAGGGFIGLFILSGFLALIYYGSKK